jgi:hypothetical protein
MTASFVDLAIILIREQKRVAWAIAILLVCTGNLFEMKCGSAVRGF